ncbi:MAG: glycosyltransferase family 1 protein [Candidatus Staskawiczbacteria bacterium]|nr:glycosyltransferase family 1 protein [Candidatus Staskawiczbacteria bacterium]
MKKNIGILFSVSRKMGVFQYGLSIIEGLINYCGDFNYTILYFDKESPKEFLKAKNLDNVNFIPLDGSQNSFMGKIKTIINVLLGRPFFAPNKKNKDTIKNSGIDLLIIPFPLLFGFENKIPYIVSIPDIMHKYYHNFPEYNFKARIKRDIVYKCSAENSVLSAVESKQGADDLNKFYKIPKEKIMIAPLIPPGYVYELKNMDEKVVDSLLSKYNLPEKFIFYPAQFWFHKNHLRLIKSLKIIKDKYKAEVNLVLAGDPGANKKNYLKVMELAEKSGIKNQIFHLGYAPDEEIVALYKKSWALVFPTLIGPTSIPPLEAIVLGTPVLCSNLFAMPEEVGNAGLLFNPFLPEDMAEKIYQLWTDGNLRENLVKNAKKMAEGITRESFTNKWENAINEALNL